MPDQRSVMKEFRALEQRRQVAGLTPEEAKRHAALRDLVGSDVAAPARGGFDVSAAAARLRESLLPAGLRSRPPEAGPPPPVAPPVELEAAAPPPEPPPWTPSLAAGQEGAPVEPQAEAVPLDPGTVQWPEPAVEPVAGPATIGAEQLFEPASLAREPKPQAWNPEAPGYDPDAPYDEEAWIAAGYDPNVAYDWSAYGAGPETQPAGADPAEAAPFLAEGDGAEVAPTEVSPAHPARAEEAVPAEASIPFDPEAPFDHAKWFGREATPGATASGEAMAWNAGPPVASPEAWLDAAPGAPPPELGEYDDMAMRAPAAPVELEALPEAAPESTWPEEPGAPAAAPPAGPPVFGEYDELAAGPAAGAAPETEAVAAAGAGEASPLPPGAAWVAAVEAAAPPEGYEFLGMPGEPGAPAEGADATVEVAPAPEPPEELPGGPPLDMGVAPQEWQAESVLDQGFQLASDGSFGMLEPVAAPAAQAWTAPQPEPAAGPVEEGWSSPPALDLAAPFEPPTLTPAEPVPAWRPEPEAPLAEATPAGEGIPPLDLGQPVEAVDLAPPSASGLAVGQSGTAPEVRAIEPAPPVSLAPWAELAPPAAPAPPVELGGPGEAPLSGATPAPAGLAAAGIPDEELPTLEVEEVLEEVAAEPATPPQPLDFGPPAAEDVPAEAAPAFPGEPRVEAGAAAEEPLLVPVEAPAASEEPLLVPVATPPPAFSPARPPSPAEPVVPPPLASAAPPAPPPAAVASPPPLRPAVPPPAPVPAPVAATPSGPSRVVVHTVDGQVRRGLLSGADLDQPELVLAPQGPGSPERIPTDTVKAIFFMLAPGETAPPPAGRKVRVTFRDGRQVAGYSPDFHEGTVGFFMIPADTRTNTARIWVYQAAVRQVSFS